MLRVPHRPRNNTAMPSRTPSGAGTFHLRPANTHKIHQPRICSPRPEKPALVSSLNLKWRQNQRQAPANIQAPAIARMTDRIQASISHGDGAFPIHERPTLMLRILMLMDSGSEILTLTRAISSSQSSTWSGLPQKSRWTTWRRGRTGNPQREQAHESSARIAASTPSRGRRRESGCSRRPDP